MHKLAKLPEVQIESPSKLNIVYHRNEESVSFDICDFNGNQIKSGQLLKDQTELEINKLVSGEYFLFILDGPHIYSHKFAV